MLKFKKTKYISLDAAIAVEKGKQREKLPLKSNIGNVVFDEHVEKVPAVPDGAWIKCDSCKEMLFHEDVKANYYCCPKCNAHFRISAFKRLRMVVDQNSFVEWDKHFTSENVLDFPDYKEKLLKLQYKTGMVEGVITGKGKIQGNQAVMAAMDSSFLMGSMGQTVGEKITRAVERATKEKLPVIIFTTSGGARMQEGIVSLMQMAKTSGALKRHSDAGLLYITVLTDPTTGGVTASFAMLGDIILAEPGALIGFAGPRVIEQTIGQKLPEGFQRAEFLVKKGFIDKIVARKNMRQALGRLLSFHCLERSQSDDGKSTENQQESRTMGTGPVSS